MPPMNCQISHDFPDLLYSNERFDRINILSRVQVIEELSGCLIIVVFQVNSNKCCDFVMNRPPHPLEII
jgi:hypothetical protein